jgi:hypothetical protein
MAAQRWKTQSLIALAGLPLLLVAPAPAGAISLSHGIQMLPISMEECGRRGAQALANEGYGQVGPSALMAGFKGPHGVYIYCGARPDGVTSVNIFVATENSTDGNAPGAERVRLQQRMEVAAAPPPPPVVGGACTGFAGAWRMSGFGEATLVVDGAGRASGGYTNGGGRIEGSVAGDTLDGTWAQPGRNGGLQARLAPDGRTFSCEWTEHGRYAGNCASTCSGAAVRPAAAAPLASFAGQWDSNYGGMTINVQGTQLSGTYANPPGRIEGTVQGLVFGGQWIQADRRGRLRLELAPGGRSFTGTWTELDGRGGGAWTGNRR